MRTNQLASILSISQAKPAGRRVPTVQGAVDEWLLDRQGFKNLSKQTIHWYRERIRYLVQLVGPERVVTDVELEDVRRLLVDSRTRGNADVTVDSLFRAARAFTRWCFRQGWPMDVRLLWMEPPIIGGEREVEIFTADQVRQLQEVWADNLRNLFMCNLLLGTGIRLSELVGLQVDDRHQDQIEVRWQTSKGRKTRWPPLSTRLQRDWLRYVERDRPPVGGEKQLLLRADGKRLTKWGVEKAFDTLEARTRVHCNPHRFRHTFATWYCRKHFEEGLPLDLERLRLILGHEGYDLLPVYVHLARQDVLVKDWDRVAPY